MQVISIINNSKKITTAQLQAAVNAVQKQISGEFNDTWAKNATLEINSTNPASWPVTIMDKLDNASVGGYHSVDKLGRPFAKVLATTDWQYTLSHELLEMIHNPYIQEVETININNNNYSIMEEVADATDKVGYKIDGVNVSNFVTPNFYDMYHVEGQKYDHLGLLNRPLQLYNGGFMSWFDDKGQYYQAIKAKGKIKVRQLTGVTPTRKGLGITLGLISILIFTIFKLRK